MLMVTRRPLRLSVIVTRIISNPDPFLKIHHFITPLGGVEMWQNIKGRISRYAISSWQEQAINFPIDCQ